MSIFSTIKNIIDDGKWNRELYRSGAADRGEVRTTTVGWRRGADTPDPGNDCITGIDTVTGHYTYATPSGNKEWFRVVRRR